MKRLLVLLVLAAAAVPALAQQRLPTFAEDGERDVRGRLDIVRVALGKRTERTLRGELTMRRSWTTDDVRGGSLCMRLHTRRDPESQPPDYLVCAVAPADGEELIGRVLRDRGNGLPRAVGDAVITRPSRRKVHLRFDVEDIRDPAAVEFSAESVTRGDRCPEPVGCRDTAPDAPATRRLPLHPDADRG